MVIQLPRDIEARLNKLAEREGKAADVLVADAVEAMLVKSEPFRQWLRPKAVGPVRDGGLDLERLDEWMADSRAPRPPGRDARRDRPHRGTAVRQARLA